MAKPIPPPFTIQVLTAWNLIEGTVAGDTFLRILSDGEGSLTIPMTSVKIQSTRASTDLTNFYKEYQINPVKVLAYFLTSLPPHIASYWIFRDYKTPICGVFHLGPYQLSGKMMVYKPMSLMKEHPAFDVRCTSQVPGVFWGGLYAPYAIVSGMQIGGWEPT